MKLFFSSILFLLTLSLSLLAKEASSNPEAARRVAAAATKQYAQQKLSEAEKGFQEALRLDPQNF